MDKLARLRKIQNVALTFKHKHQNLVGSKVKIVEVGPRDGLQNQKQLLSLTDKVTLINRLSKSGLKTIQVGSFVSPKWIPQMANSKQLFQLIQKAAAVSYPCLVPNIKGMESALEAGVKEIAVFASATEGFSQKNLNCSIEESLKRFEPVIRLAKQKDIRVRGYVSMVMGCPFQGEVHPSKVNWVVQKLLELGCYEVSLGDTVGRGTVEKTYQLFKELQSLPKDKLAVHFHDTFDNAIENILTAISLGCRTVDSSIGGLGGCPYSMKPVGNVCTQNVAFAIETAGLRSDLNLAELSETGQWICKLLSRPSLSIL